MYSTPIQPTVASVEVIVAGRARRVPSIVVRGHTVIASRGWISVASIRDEHFATGNPVNDFDAILRTLQSRVLPADVLTIFQRPPDVMPHLRHRVEWQNYAAVPISSYDAWWTSLPRKTRSNIARAARRGVVVKAATFDDEFVQGIHRLCNDKPTRQGRRFWHYGKSVEQVRNEHSSHLDRSVFVGAYHEGELIGFVKLVFVDQLASIKHILALDGHRDKRPMNAMLAKVVEICVDHGARYLLYGGLTYGNKRNCTLSEFKRRNGFLKLEYPRYHVPLTLKGRLYVALKLHRGALGLLPSCVLDAGLAVRRYVIERVARLFNRAA